MLPLISLGGFDLYLYPCLMGISWGVGYHISSSLNDKYQLIKNLPLYFILFLSLSWLGAKIFYLLTVDETAIVRELGSSFWLGGGFVFYGGLIFAAMGALFIKKIKGLRWSDFSLFIPGLLLGHSIGRLGCFFAGCCYGVEVEESFYSIHLHNTHRFPVQLLEALLLLICGLFFYYNFQKIKKNAIILYLIFYPLIRIITEFFRGDSYRGEFFGLSTSQFISGVLLTSYACFLFIRNNLRKQKE